MATLLADYIENANSKYPSHLDTNGKGGYVVFATEADKDASKFATTKRKEGMLCYVVATKKTYRCQADLSWKEETTTVDTTGLVKDTANINLLYGEGTGAKRFTKSLSAVLNDTDGKYDFVTDIGLDELTKADFGFDDFEGSFGNSTRILVSGNCLKNFYQSLVKSSVPDNNTNTQSVPTVKAVYDFVDTGYAKSDTYTLTVKGASGNSSVSLDDINAGTTILVGSDALTWGNITGKPSTFSPATHTHTKSQITDLTIPTTLKNPTTLTVRFNNGDTVGTNRFVYDGSSEVILNITPDSIGAASAQEVNQMVSTIGTKIDDTDVIGVLSSGGVNQLTFGDLEWQDAVSDGSSALVLKSGLTWANIGNKPTTFTPSTHSHTISQITDFPTIPTVPSSLKNPHTIKISLSGGTTEGTNLVTYDGSVEKQLNITAVGIGAAASSHTHAISNITNLQTTLDGKQATSNLSTSVTTDKTSATKYPSVKAVYDFIDGEYAKSDSYTLKVKGASTTADVTLDAISNGTTVLVDSNSLTWNNISNKPSTYTPDTHTHTKSQITDFPASLKNPSSIILTLNGGTTEGTNKFTYDGSAAKTINITAANVGALASTAVSAWAKASTKPSYGINEITGTIETATSSTAVTLTSNKLCIVSDTVETLTVTKGTDIPGIANEYKFQFTAGTSCTVEYDGFGTIKWLDGEVPTFTSGRTYEISILNGCGVCAEFYTA